MPAKKNKEEGGEADHRPLSFRDAMNRMMDDRFWDPFESPWRGWRNAFNRFPKVDVSETDDEVRVVANIPGVDPEKVDIEIDNDTLVISGEMDREEEEKDEKIYRYEREYGSFRRQVPLPTHVKADAVTAKAKNGVLSIVLPKAESAKRRKVKIETE